MATKGKVMFEKQWILPSSQNAMYSVIQQVQRKCVGSLDKTCACDSVAARSKGISVEARSLKVDEKMSGDGLMQGLAICGIPPRWVVASD